MMATQTLTPPKVRTGADGREVRLVTAPLEARAATDGAMPFAGHPVVYDRWTTICDWFGDYMERIIPGACRESIATDDIRLLVNHDANLVLARSRGEAGGTLKLSEDGTGVLAEAELAPTTYGRDLAVSLARGDVSGMSFAFRVIEESWDVRPDGVWLRDITKLQLFDVSAVTYPAYEETDAMMRSRLGTGRGDERVISGALQALRDSAAALELLLSPSEQKVEDDGKRDTAAAIAADGARRHRAMGVYLGMARTTQEEK